MLSHQPRGETSKSARKQRPGQGRAAIGPACHHDQSIQMKQFVVATAYKYLLEYCFVDPAQQNSSPESPPSTSINRHLLGFAGYRGTPNERCKY
jgi:hypothetical protein